ncbi:MAG: hypothetical protein CVV64_04850 [Candidatus Wallbacteria bacterium HGW-Wallbacteria-1]|uniref:Uncharacterized protein n=1 Tax=Candidatus Wallbacteria bacterium HGW-Wallbacteria-1 TaxID=2013854 RepID=A0A2N1PS55_9BACT|nr:MAG: hypothetical protein CVV64_04850 [Candidatus Wallbacteria bacterium HGW-Wallbacteria-1]
MIGINDWKLFPSASTAKSHTSAGSASEPSASSKAAAWPDHYSSMAWSVTHMTTDWPAAHIREHENDSKNKETEKATSVHDRLSSFKTLVVTVIK